MQRSDIVEAKGCIYRGRNSFNYIEIEVIRMEETKKCKECGDVFKISNFRKWKETRRGKTKIRIGAKCIECSRESEKLRAERARSKNPEKYKAIIKKYQHKKRVERIEKTNPKTKIHIRKCKECGRYDVLKYTPTGAGLDYCKNHVAKYKSLGKTWTVQSKDAICKDCGKKHIAKTKNARCEKCRAANNKKYKKKYKKKRKALIRGAKYGVVFNYRDVFKRDKWRCKMCGCKVQKKRIYADNAAEIDHVIPVSKGGPHIPSNVQTLCRKCNLNKSDSMIGQISLFTAGIIDDRGMPMQISIDFP